MSRDRHAASSTLGNLLGVIGVALALLALPWPKAALGAAAVGAIVFGWRRVIVRAPRRDVAQAVAAAAAIGFLVVFLVAVIDNEDVASAPAPTNEASPGRTITVDNRVTSGEDMRQDDEPVRLSTKTWQNCVDRGCAIWGTERQSGETYDAAVCQTRGEETTNGDNGSETDDANPLQVESSLYYGVRLDEPETLGYVNEVWIRRQDRGGLGLPRC